MNPVMQFARTAVDQPRRADAEIKAELVSVSGAWNSLLGIETIAKEELYRRHLRLKSDLKFAGTGYKRLSLEPLGWTVKLGIIKRYPVFALYGLNDPCMVIEGDSKFVTRPALPKALRDRFQSAWRTLSEFTTITSTFQGVIPPPVRKRIAEAKPLFEHPDTHATNIFILGEADWATTERPRPIRSWDPLVVGWDGLDLWLVAHFDLTPLERYVIEEFPALPEHTNDKALPEHRRSE